MSYPGFLMKRIKPAHEDLLANLTFEGKAGKSRGCELCHEKEAIPGSPAERVMMRQDDRDSSSISSGGSGASSPLFSQSI